MKDEELAQTIVGIAADRAKHFCCGVWFKTHRGKEEIGTGTMLLHNENQYILTCNHVARDFFRFRESGIVFANNLHLTSNEVSYFRRSERFDLALLKLESPLDHPFLRPLTISDFEACHNFALLQLDRINVLLCGFPAQKVNVRDNARSLRPLTYMTVPYEDKRTTANRLYLEYPLSDDSQQPLPLPGGLSGSLVAKIDVSTGFGNQLWHFGLHKFIAVQHKANIKGKYLVCTSLKPLFEWLRSV